MENFDHIVIGAGLGGLLTAVFLAKEGKKVAVIEQNRQIGGCLQTFSFDRKVFDSCVHYIGALDEGQTQHRIFRYAGIMEELKLRKLDEDCFDEIIYGNNPISYPQAQGLSHFVEQLLSCFPRERQALVKYKQLMEQVADSFPLYKLRGNGGAAKDKVIDWELAATIEGLTDDQQLQNALLGNSLLYAGERGKTPFYVHALSLKSYIDSAHKCIGGSSQISKLLWRRLQEYGGTIFTREKICRLHMEKGNVKSAIAESGREFRGKHFIANTHPQKVLEWIDSPLLKPGYRNRIRDAENSISAFMLNLVFKPGTVKYKNHNIYWNKTIDALAPIPGNEATWPHNYAIYFGEDRLRNGYADTAAILTYMNHAVFSDWADSHNRSAAASDRAAAYHERKQQKAALLLQVVGDRFPEISQNIQSLKIASPLTFRDYMGTADGSMYGIITNVTRPAQTRILSTTKIRNLLLTGQNIGLHGVLGVSISAVQICCLLLGAEYFLKKFSDKK